MDSLLANYPAGTPPPGVKSNFDNPVNHSTSLKVLNGIFVGFMAFFVIIRLISRCIVSRQRIGWDDITCIFATVGSVAHTALIVKDINIGYGRHIWDIRALTFLVPGNLLSITILDTIYVISIYLVKISLLFLFWRVFNVSSKCRQFIYFGFGGITLITIPYFSVSVYRSVNCTSIKAATLVMCRSKNVSTTQIVFGALNTITDFYILAIPVVMIRQLQIDQKKKVAFMVPFLAGLLACVISIVRLVIVGQNFGSSDSFWNGAVVSQYSTVEMNLAIICSCMVFFPAVISKSKLKLSATYQYMVSRGGSRGYNRTGGSGSSKEINSLEAQPVE